MTGIKFDINSNPVNEDFPDTLRSKEIAEFIVTKKTNSFRELVKENQIIITADTLVWFEEKCWGKPKDKMEAKKMLKTKIKFFISIYFIFITYKINQIFKISIPFL